MKKLLALILALACCLTVFTACGGGETAEEDTPSVYYLNFKPEQDQQWKDLAAAYTAETGVEVTVVTAASGEYETTLMSEMGKESAPTLFQVNGPVGLANWKDYCYDLSGSTVYGELTNEGYALKDGDKVAGIAYVIESYGIIVNKTLLAQAGYAVEDITSFAKLTLQLAKTHLASQHSHLQVWIHLLTGDSKHTLQTCQSTLNIRQMVSALQLLSKVPSLTTIKVSGIFTSTTQHVLQQNFLQKQLTTPEMNSWQVKQYSSRTVPGTTATLLAKAKLLKKI